MSPVCRVVVLMGSGSDREFGTKIAKHAANLGLTPQLRVCSAHKGTADTLKLLAELEASPDKVVLIAVAGRSNGLGPVLSGNGTLPVINCPPAENPAEVAQDVWSSLRVPSGLGCTTVLYPESAALAAAQIHALHNHLVWSRLRVKQLTNYIALKTADVSLRNQKF
ncbi:hypothetical protein QAD02_017256 [Eretmocerus hayati]|uniref:Uncharacterized protein n=1 Tax=Eretmocerus hayati TaxID=131215 RepID=A0ACC2PFX6_9HYME|nr:hypothetical protein QAD02_017256 [Eretmocerus hayati]